MERDKVIKLSVAVVIGLAAVIILALNFFGGGPTKPKGVDKPPPPPAERSGSGRSVPGETGG